MLKIWEELDQKEIGKVRNEAIVALPVSSLEQHALHLPTGTDRMIGEGVIRETAARTKKTLIMLPPLCYGFSDHHLNFDGTVSISQSTLIAVLKDIAFSIERRGWKQLIVFNSHGGNSPALKVAINEIGAASSLEVTLIEYWDFLKPYIAEMRKSEMGGIGHAGELETSLMMALCPHLVHMQEAGFYSSASEYKGTNPDMFAANRVYRYRDFSTISSHGNVGIPDVSSAQSGRKLLDIISGEISAFIDAHVPCGAEDRPDSRNGVPTRTATCR